MSMFCEKCGVKYPEGTAFCGKCGTKLVSSIVQLPERHHESDGEVGHTGGKKKCAVVVGTIILVIVLFLGVSMFSGKSFSSFDGPVLPSDFFESLPFRDDTIEEAVEWFEQHNGYRIKDKSDDGEIKAIYRGNVDWGIEVTGVHSSKVLDGFATVFYTRHNYSEKDSLEIFHSIIEELTALYGSPTRILDSDPMNLFARFEHGKAEILIQGDSTEGFINIDVTYSR